MKLCDYSLGPGGGGGGKATEAMQLSHFSGRQVCSRRNAVNSTPKSLLSDRERGERSPFWASHWGGLLENEGVNVLSSEAGRDERVKAMSQNNVASVASHWDII